MGLVSTNSLRDHVSQLRLEQSYLGREGLCPSITRLPTPGTFHLKVTTKTTLVHFFSSQLGQFHSLCRGKILKLIPFILLKGDTSARTFTTLGRLQHVRLTTLLDRFILTLYLSRLCSQNLLACHPPLIFQLTPPD